jgi:hypothetical protein
MNAITYLFSFFPTKQVLSIVVATPLANTLSYLIVQYMIGSTFISPVICHSIAYIILNPISDITYIGCNWIYQKHSTIELVPMNNEDLEFVIIN